MGGNALGLLHIDQYGAASLDRDQARALVAAAVVRLLHNACPQPVLHASTPEELSDKIRQAHAEALLKHPALRMECGTPLPWRSG